MKNIKSQVAIIVTFVIAVIILMVMVFINIAKVSEVKVASANASDTAALAIASKIGSMSHYLKEKPLEGNLSKCVFDFTINWTTLKNLIPALFTGTAPLNVHMAMIASPILQTTFTTSKLILEGIQKQFFENMSLYNSIREEALYGALVSLQKDDVLLKNAGGYNFCEDVDSDGNCDSGGEVFNLSRVRGIGKAKVVGRFFAWYHTKRLPLVSEEALKSEVEGFMTELKEYIDLGVLDRDAWVYPEASFVVEPAPSDNNIKVTCSEASCPSWVVDKAQGRINVSSINEGQKSGENYIPGGFLKNKLWSLADRLNKKYPEEGFNISSEIVATIGNFAEIVVRIKELFEEPVLDRAKTVDEWFEGFFYKDEYEYTSEGGKRDIYDQLTLVNHHIDKWLSDFKKIDELIRGVVPSPIGHNEYGLGSAASSCYTQYNCCASDCTKRCCEANRNCSFAGVYCSACGGSNPPVCNTGDLYGNIPAWCPLSSKSPGCSSSCGLCSTNSQCDTAACSFQGDLAHNNTSGYTEVGQAIEILKALESDVKELLILIEKFSDRKKTILEKDDDKRKEIVYAWKGKDGRRHLVRVAIKKYPTDLPMISEQRQYYSWFIIPIPQKCYVLENFENISSANPFEIHTASYDEDIAVGEWNMRYRKNLENEKFNQTHLDAIIIDVFDGGGLSEVNKNYVTDIVKNYAIVSETKGYYGPDKEDIYIEKVK